MGQERLRQHQRRLSAAICTLRKLRKEQRVLQEVDNSSLDDVAKVSTQSLFTVSFCQITQNAVELVRGMGQEQRNLTQRIGHMEDRLEQIQLGLGTLTQMLRVNNGVKMEEVQSRILENGSILEEDGEEDE